ncbi:hypothetical protein [Mycobacterium attenuatum]|uniref:hypothetical protein n=1 Tax=Mycobacterium attenuatum TaxID=2341086 RepID=UPI000F01E005|nr:hypothetical protein [Mycobacterium attenuatum]
MRVTPGIQDFGGGRRADMIGVSQNGGDHNGYGMICVTAEAARALATALIKAAAWCDEQF